MDRTNKYKGKESKGRQLEGKAAGREGSWKGRQLEAFDRRRMCSELQTYSHSLTSSSDHLYNTITGQVVVTDINKHQADELAQRYKMTSLRHIRKGSATQSRPRGRP